MEARCLRGELRAQAPGGCQTSGLELPLGAGILDARRCSVRRGARSAQVDGGRQVESGQSQGALTVQGPLWQVEREFEQMCRELRFECERAYTEAGIEKRELRAQVDRLVEEYSRCRQDGERMARELARARGGMSLEGESGAPL